MIFHWFGQANFKIQGEKTTVITDPFTKDFGLKVPRLNGDILTISHDHNDHNNVKAVRGIEEDATPFVITDPGEYEIKNTFVYGIAAYHDDSQGKERGTNNIYRIEMDGISIAHLGDLGHTLENGQLQKLEGIDILLIPVGGVFTIDAKQASQVISQLEPRIVIPMHYKIPGLKFSGGKMIAGLDNFRKEIAVTPTEEINKFKISKKDLPQDQMQVIVLQP